MPCKYFIRLPFEAEQRIQSLMSFITCNWGQWTQMCDSTAQITVMAKDALRETPPGSRMHVGNKSVLLTIAMVSFWVEKKYYCIFRIYQAKKKKTLSFYLLPSKNKPTWDAAASTSFSISVMNHSHNIPMKRLIERTIANQFNYILTLGM